ncbi:4-phosphoerythronate dehydrogenase PdxB [Sansalvadorimonas verongulae]|uniref:4-phosphoerythronate dehydrogenase PdxB n=1 Tax=Sansalvadorimonas verongulae TaxID=2172824 RepID=UPI0012BC7654|nr:4-phosphoerythronate dehydrogenase PdxB [Sansalvadorimonas verongulae]MTI12581.1 4-phosphoerythronate dehydrogenase PdxB [Sansalvadorimonas verongulae]
MKIVADENIPLLNSFFEGFGEIVTRPGRTMSAEDVQDADLLLVRSVTKVNEQLLAGSSVKFVATATSGTDHVDKEWLRSNNIGFSSAAGCNAEAVVDYVMAALDTLTEEQGFHLQGKTVGIVGHGQVGSRLYQRLTALGVKCLNCDPFKEAPDNTGIDELVEKVDILSLHTPYTHNCEHPTFHLLNDERLRRFTQSADNAILVNAGRGEVVDNNALKTLLNEGQPLTAVLDVWEGEPTLDPELLNLVAIGTPHIAGYTLDGKVRGTAMVYQAACEFLGRGEQVQYDEVNPEPLLKALTIASDNHIEATSATVRMVYDIRRDDLRLRRAVARHPNNIAREFDWLRRHYPRRREFSTLCLKLERCSQDVRDYLAGYGFSIPV